MRSKIYGGLAALLLAGPAMAATDYPTGYTKCAKEAAACSMTGTRSVAFGKSGVFVYATLAGNFTCQASLFPSSTHISGTRYCSYGATSGATSSAAVSSAAKSSVAASSAAASSKAASSVAASSKAASSVAASSLAASSAAATGKFVEKLDRGVVVVPSSSGVLVSWRLLGTESASTGFNVYRGSTKLNASPITASTNYQDTAGSTGSAYSVRAVVNGVEQAAASALELTNGYLSIPISQPAGGTTPDGVAYTYEANDGAPADLDGDGQYEIVLKWQPTNAKDNSQSGYTGNTFIDAYKLNGTRLWRIDLGKNIRAGAHYTQMVVYDLDGDGKAEVMLKTADGTKDGKGTVIGSSSADYRNSAGYVLSGPEFLTVFNGQTGAAMATTDYLPARGTVGSWGDTYGNRVDRFLAGVAYLDGARPSAVFSRGYYTRAVVVAWDWRNGQLTRRWTHDSATSGSGLYGEGAHYFTVGDVNNDGKDDIIYGAAALKHDGTLLHRTGLGHGDAIHLFLQTVVVAFGLGAGSELCHLLVSFSALRTAGRLRAQPRPAPSRGRGTQNQHGRTRPSRCRRPWPSRRCACPRAWRRRCCHPCPCPIARALPFRRWTLTPAPGCRRQRSRWRRCAGWSGRPTVARHPGWRSGRGSGGSDAGAVPFSSACSAPYFFFVSLITTRSSA